MLSGGALNVTYWLDALPTKIIMVRLELLHDDLREN